MTSDLKKKAAEKASQVYMGWTEIDTPRHLIGDRVEKDIASALVEFAREAIERAGHWTVIGKAIEEKARAEARAEALEAAENAAANVAEEEWRKHIYQKDGDVFLTVELTALRIRDAIRALKEQGEGK